MRLPLLTYYLLVVHFISLSWNHFLVVHLPNYPNYSLVGASPSLEPPTTHYSQHTTHYPPLTTRYISLFWKEFAANKRKNVAGERITDVVRREQALEDLTAQYIRDAEALSGWAKGKRTLTLTLTPT